eukprot:407442-Hanusia_phi.AAC.1
MGAARRACFDLRAPAGWRGEGGGGGGEGGGGRRRFATAGEAGADQGNAHGSLEGKDETSFLVSENESGEGERGERSGRGGGEERNGK